MACSTNACVLVILYILVSIYHLHKSSTPLQPCQKSAAVAANTCIEPLLYHYKNNSDEERRNENKSHSLFLLELHVPSPISSSLKSPQPSPSQLSPPRLKWALVSTCSLSSNEEKKGMMFHFNTDIQSEPGTASVTAIGSAKSKLIRTECKLTIPNYSRIRTVRREDMHLLKGKFVLKQILSTGNNQGSHDSKNHTNRQEVLIAETIFDLTRIIYKNPKNKRNNDNQGDVSPHVPHYKYYRQPVVLRIVTDSQLYSRHSGPIRRDGYTMETAIAATANLGANHKYQRQYCYRPIFYVDDVALRHSSQIELALPPQSQPQSQSQLSTNSEPSPTEISSAESSSKPKPPVTLHIKISFITPFRHSMQNQLYTALSMVESTNILQPSELDELRYLLSDEYMYRFIITQVIGMIHVSFDYLAFSNEIQFYVGRKKSNNMTGISLSSLYSRCICDVIILLYLMDGDGNTSWFVLFGIASGICVNLWKLYQFLQPKLHWNWKRNDSDRNGNYGQRVQLPFISLRDFSTVSTTEQLTIDYDTIARTYLSLILYPLIFGLALYGKQFYVYKSWYSWMISNLANAVYTFGFISLCPQLYINYRLKSVAHLPWKVFVYKIFNTFVDDVFAFLVEMPMKHKIMTLRDDVVFVIFLVQAYIYRVDKKRTNEFGYAYEKEDEGKVSVGEQQCQEKENVKIENADESIKVLEKKKEEERNVETKQVKID